MLIRRAGICARMRAGSAPWALAGHGWCVDPPGTAAADVRPSVRRIGYACAHGPDPALGGAALAWTVCVRYARA